MRFRACVKNPGSSRPLSASLNAMTQVQSRKLFAEALKTKNDRFKRTTSASARHPKDCLPTDEAILFPAVDEEKIGTGAIEEILDFSASPRRDRIHIGGVSGAVPQQGHPCG